MDSFIMLQDRTPPAATARRPRLDLRLTLGAVGTLLIVLLALLTPRTPLQAEPAPTAAMSVAASDALASSAQDCTVLA